MLVAVPSKSRNSFILSLWELKKEKERHKILDKILINFDKNPEISAQFYVKKFILVKFSVSSSSNEYVGPHISWNIFQPILPLEGAILDLFH